MPGGVTGETHGRGDRQIDMWTHCSRFPCRTLEKPCPYPTTRQLLSPAPRAMHCGAWSYCVHFTPCQHGGPHSPQALWELESFEASTWLPPSMAQAAVVHLRGAEMCLEVEGTPMTPPETWGSRLDRPHRGARRG
ncbi:hypothetical protein UPYG_G00034550 [Umbra pygmaea]|uniref:Uncharacterized protein n=1 Tax=Umbra pygmaea TaxID=75934 RepID=A0ABD0XNI4_UMBPY